MNKSENINELAGALSKAQGMMQSATKDAKNPFFKSSYATLASVIDASRDALSKNNLAVIQSPQNTEKGVVLETTIMHSSGQWVMSTYPINPVKNDPQGIGSAITYAKRYALQSMLCIPSEDDDGNAASQKTQVSIQTAVITPKPFVASDEPGNFVIPIGKKFKGKKLSEVDPQELESFIDWLKEQQSSEKGLDPKAQELLGNAELYLQSMH